MAYIGKEPTVGNFQKCDALTASATADYTLQVGSSNVSPESVNHMIVSLNGVIQQPTTAYTVSGSTLSFASALTSNDTIDFVILLGNVLDIGTPSDDTVATAKIQDDAVTLAKMASGTDGNIISFDTSGNPVAVATGNDGQVLTSSGAGAVCAFEDAPGGGLTEADTWRLTANTTSQGDVTSNWERVDNTGFGKPGTGLTESSGIFTFPSTGYWLVATTVAFNGEYGSSYNSGHLMTTTDNSTYANAVLVETAHEGNVGNSCATQNHLFDVTDTANCKFKLNWGAQDGSIAIVGNTDKTRTGITVIRLTDT